MSPAVIYDTSLPWAPPQSGSSVKSHNFLLSPQPCTQESKGPQWESPTPNLPRGFSLHERSFSVPPFMLNHSGINEIVNPQSTTMANPSVGMYSSALGGHMHPSSGSVSSADLSFVTHKNGSLTASPGQDSSLHPPQLPSGNSRSARMRRALSVPTRGVPATTAISQTPSISDPLPSFPRLQCRQLEVIAEFGPRDQVVSYPVSSPHISYESVGNLTPLGSTALPPRLQATSPPLGRSRFKSWRPTDEELPPRFRSSPQTSSSRVLTPPASLWNPVPTTRQDTSLNHLATSFHPQLSRPQHLSSFLSNHTSYTHEIPSDNRLTQQPDFNLLELSSKARGLAPIGAERAQRLASTANVNYSNNSNNLKAHSTSRNLSNIGPPPGLDKSLLDSPNFVIHEPHPQLFQGSYPSVFASPSSLLGSTSNVASVENVTELEKLFRRMKMNNYAPKIFSPLSPLRNPDSWALSDGKWRREEREQRRQRTMYCCETSVFRRKTTDQRSRIECEEFAYGLEVFEHCFWCRQDTLCKRLLIHRARESIRSNSSSPLSDYSSSSDDGISDEETILDTPSNSIPHLPVTFASEKLLEFRMVEVVDADEENIGPDSPPSAASRTRASPVLVHTDI